MRCRYSAVIYGDGSMHITQTWEGRFEEGTESYIPMNAPDYFSISELTVSDQNGSYAKVSDWNIDDLAFPDGPEQSIGSVGTQNRMTYSEETGRLKPFLNKEKLTLLVSEKSE